MTVRCSCTIPETGVYCHAIIAFVTVIPGTWTSTATARPMCVTAMTTLFQEMDTHCHATCCSCILGIAIVGIINQDATLNFRELICDQGLLYSRK